MYSCRCVLSSSSSNVIQRLNISCESSARLTIHTKCQILFSQKITFENQTMSAVVVTGTLHVGLIVDLMT